MDKKKNINIIDTLYTNATYSSRYGLDIFLSIIIVGVLLCLIIYFSVLNNLQSLRANWDTEKCNPINLPFIHIINPDPNLTPEQQITKNINECLTDGVNDMASNSLNDIYSKLNIFNDLKTYFDDFVTFIQGLFKWLFSTITYLISLLISILQKTFLGITYIFLKIDDMFNKFLGIITANFFIFIQLLNMGIAFILNFASIATIMIMIPLHITLYILLGSALALSLLIIAVAWIPFFGWALAGLLSLILLGVILAIVSTTVMIIILTIIMSALIQIQNTAKRFIAPSLKQGRNVNPSPQFSKPLTSSQRAEKSDIDGKIKEFMKLPF